MVNIIKLRKGLDIKLKGTAQLKDVQVPAGDVFALCPADYHGVTPKVVVKEGDKVLAGDSLFVNKHFPSVGFASPVSGNCRSAWRKEKGAGCESAGRQQSGISRLRQERS